MRSAVVISFYYMMFGYPWWRLSQVLAPEFHWGTVELMVLLVSPAVVWVASRKVWPPFRYWLARIVYVWLGASWILMCLSLLWEAAYLLAPFEPRTLGYALLALFADVLAWAVFNANRFEVVTVALPSAKLGKTIRALQLSDVHLGSRSPRFLNRVVSASNALNPDVVFITGDLVDGSQMTRSDLAALGTLNAPAYFVIGNHERYVDCDEICEKLRDLGIHVLRDDSALARIGDVELCVTGIDDAEEPGQVESVLPTLEPIWESASNPYSILLYHRPDGLEAAADKHFDLMLCGHTHNGQLAPFNALVKRRFPRIKGLYHHQQTTLYVSVGSGTWGPPMRLGSVNELTVLELGPTADSS